MAAACRVVDAAGVRVDWDTHLVGRRALEAGSEQPLPEAVLESIRSTGRALKGPVSTALDQPFPSVNVALRRELGLFAQARRCRTWAGCAAEHEFDLTVVRETTEDLYAGVEAAPGSSLAGTIIDALADSGQALPRSAGLSVKWATEAATRRTVEWACLHALGRGLRSLVVAHKATVMRQTDGVFLDVALQVAGAHPALIVEDVLIDSLCASLVRDPHRFDVLVMPNMYGDIVSDLAAALAGGVGLVAGVNVGDAVLVFEPAHGSAPRHAGAGRANPTAAILCAALLLQSMGEEVAAQRIETAVGAVIAESRSVTYDLKPAGHAAASTDQMADAIAERLS